MISLSTSWSELQATEPFSRLVLERYGVVDPEASATLRELLELQCKEPSFVCRLLNLYADQHFRMTDFEDHSLAAILEYLKQTHTLYQERFLPKMDMAIAGIKQNFPDHPVAPVLDAFFRTYRNELLEHIELEENKLFPYAWSLYDGSCNFEYSIKEFKLQHDHHVEDELGSILKEVDEKYPVIADSMAFRAFNRLLSQFEKDLFVHHLIEERVFVTRVHEMELQAANLLY